MKNLSAGRGREQRVRRSHSGARGFCTSAILDGQHDEILVANRIDNPIIAFANPIEMVLTFERFDARGTRMIPDGIEPFCEGLPKRFLECSELLFGRRGKENCGDHRVISEPQFFQDKIKRLGALLVCLGQRGSGIDEVDTIFQVFQESQIFNGHHGRDRAATSAQEYTFFSKRRAIDRIGKPLSFLLSLWISHGAPPQTASGQTDRSFIRMVQAVQWGGGEVNRRENGTCPIPIFLQLGYEEGAAIASRHHRSTHPFIRGETKWLRA